MPSIWVPEAYAAFSADGTATGYAKVASNEKFYPGAEVFVSSDTIAGTRAVITDLVSTTDIGIRFIGEGSNQPPRYGRNPMNGFLLAENARISMPAQVVRVDQPTFSKAPLM